jgi:hypothetical protein
VDRPASRRPKTFTKHEVAGSWAPVVQRALWGFDGGADLDVGCDADGTRQGDLQRQARLEAWNRHLGKRSEGISTSEFYPKRPSLIWFNIGASGILRARANAAPTISTHGSWDHVRYRLEF